METLGLLLRARDQKQITHVLPLMEYFQAGGFGLDVGARAAILELAGEG